MRTLLMVAILAVLAATVLAGCTTDTKTEGGNPPPPAAEYSTVPPTVDAAVVLGDLKFFSQTYPERADNLPAHVGAREWISQQYADAGLSVWLHNFTNEIDQQNVVGIKWGADRANWLVVGAHYDMTVNGGEGPARARSQGAYDDGSGTLLVVGLAKAFANVTTPYTIAFVAFDGEERGLQGSGAFAEAMIEGNHPYGKVDIRGMVDLDMFGLNCPGVDTPINFDTNSPELKAFIQTFAAEHTECGDTIKYEGISLGRSDYAHFFQLGVPTGFFISNFEDWSPPANLPTTPIDLPYAYPFWHVEDTYSTMEIMAGSPEDLQAGFQTAADLSAGLVHFMANENALTGKVVA